MRLYKRILLVTGTGYLLGAFVAGSVNCAEWHIGGKITLVIAWVITVFSLILNEEDKHK